MRGVEDQFKKKAQSVVGGTSIALVGPKEEEKCFADGGRGDFLPGGIPRGEEGLGKKRG